jgi:hypothetical protein
MKRPDRANMAKSEGAWALRLDGPWSLTMLYGAVILLGLPLQRVVWTAMAAHDAALFYVLVPVAAQWLLSLAGIVAAVQVAPRTSAALADALARRLSRRAGGAEIVLAVAALLAGLGIADFVLDAFPNSGDEYAYLFQAKQFVQGRLWADAPPLGYTFVPYRTWLSDGKWVSQYPPGWPLALALGMLARIPPWSVNAVLGALTILAVRAWFRRFPDAVSVTVGLVLYAMTPFYLLNSGSFHSHMLSALLIVLLCLCCRRGSEQGSATALLAAGMLMGLIGITRYFSLILLVPALLWWFFRDLDRWLQRWRAAGLVALGGLPFLGLLMAYQYLVTGSPYHSSYAVMAVPDVAISVAPHALLAGLVCTGYRLIELGVWSSPILPAVYVAGLVLKLRNRALVFYDLVFPSFILGFILFATLGGNRYGPRYYFEAFPLMLATVISAVSQAAAGVRGPKSRAVALHAALGSAVYAATALPFALAAFHHQVERREEPYRLAAAARLVNAIVVLKTTSDAGLLVQDLARNDAGLQGPVLYARDDVAPALLAKSFPRRAIWLYERVDPDRPGRLVPAAAPR